MTRRRTAAQLMDELNRDRSFVERQKQVEADQERGSETYRIAARPLLEELASAGFEVETVGALRRLGSPYSDAIGTLVRWLPLVDDAAVKADIIRTLSVPWAQAATSALLSEFVRAESTENLRWAIGNALEVLATDAIADALIAIATERRYGRAREMVALALGNLSDPRVPNVLLQLLDDEEVVGHAVMALGKLGTLAATSRIEALLRHPKPWIQVEAKTALQKIARSSRS